MPVYEYACNACGHEFEEWQKMSDDPVKTCPTCGKDEVERLISRTSFHLKGGGWYSDLYASSKPGAGKSGASGKDSGSASGSSSKSASSDKGSGAAGGSSSSGSSSSGSSSSGSTSKAKTKAGS